MRHSVSRSALLILLASTSALASPAFAQSAKATNSGTPSATAKASSSNSGSSGDSNMIIVTATKRSESV